MAAVARRPVGELHQRPRRDHPSQPNDIALFSGGTQGITNLAAAVAMPASTRLASAASCSSGAATRAPCRRATITTRRREVFYWCTVLATFALGTAFGDLTASTLGLGYLASGILFAAAIAVPAVAHRWWGLNPVLAFWAAYMLTRPLGASFADWLAVSPDRGGLDLGTGPVSAVLVLVIAVAVAGVAARGRRE